MSLSISSNKPLYCTLMVMALLLIVPLNSGANTFNTTAPVNNYQSDMDIIEDLDFKTNTEISNELRSTIHETMSNFQAGFRENPDFDSEVKYLLSSSQMDMGFSKSKVQLRIPYFEEKHEIVSADLSENMIPKIIGFTNVYLEFVGSNEVHPEAENPSSAYFNYFIGADSDDWVTNVQSYGKVVYKNLYDNIDLVYSLKNGQLKYDFYVYPGGSYEDIQLRWNGPVTLEQIDDGLQVLVSTVSGNKFFVDSNPINFLGIDQGENVIGSFDLIDSNSYRFKMGEYDRSKLLIIDPVLEFSTFIGGTGIERSSSIALDSNGDVYITGCVESPEYPITEGAYDDIYNGNFDVFITKLAANGSTLLYSTFLGGSDDDEAFSIVVDSNGDTYITGSTSSSNYPTTSGAYDVTLSAWTDVIVSKLAANGSTLIHSTYIGNTEADHANSIGIDSNQDVYITGKTRSEFFPIIAGAYDNTHNGNFDVFVTKLSNDFSILIYSTFIGGSDVDVANSIFVDDVGDAYITGYTIDGATDYPTTPGAYDQTHNGLQDIFVSKLAVNGSTLIFSTFLGGSGADYGRSLALDDNGDLYVAGETNSNNFPSTTGAYDEIGPNLFGENKAFISKFSSDGTTLLNSTFLGGMQRDAVRSLALDDNGDIFVTGITNSPEFPITPGAYDESLDAYSDIFVTKLSANLSTLLFSTFLGGQDIDSSYSIASASDGIVYITGQYLGDVGDFPITEGAFQESFGGVHDIFVTKLKLTPNAPSNIISMTESNENGKYIMLFWNAVECASATISYNVFRGTVSGSYSYLGSVPSSQKYFNDTSVIEDQAYYYVITSTNYIGESEYSSEHYTMIDSVSSVSNPSAPLNFIASAGVESVHLSWDAPIDDGGSPIVRYNLYRGQSPSDYNTVFFVTGTEFNDTFVDGGTTYYYVVGAVNEDGGRMYTDEISATPTTGTPSGVVTTTIVSTITQISTSTIDNSKLTGSQIVFTLLAFTAVVGSRIYKRKKL